MKTLSLIIVGLALLCAPLQGATELPLGTVVSSTAYEDSRVLLARSGRLIALHGYNSKASAQFIQIFNNATVPADTAVPIYTFTVAASSNFYIEFPITGARFTTGIAVSNSSTGNTKTVGSNDCWFTAIVRTGDR